MKRRDLLKAGVVLGITLPLKSFAGDANSKSKETVKLLTPDGKLVEVDKSKIASKTPVPASISDLKKWMDSQKSLNHE